METTRHFTTKVFIVEDGATALHYHPKLEIYLPPGGHVERDELPHRSGIREVREETGLEPELHRDSADMDVPGGRPLPEPEYHILYDVDTGPDGEVAHQHIDLIYFAEVDSREIDPEENEVPAEEWEWFDREDLENGDFDPDTRRMAIEAIETFSDRN
ncbi:MAG: NUDIX hydrolase [Candidatus Nanohaloarchaea archaeon]